MAESLSPACTPLRRSYDICFNQWLDGYLKITAPRPETSEKPIEGDARKQELQRQADLYEEKCGASFREYQQCLKKGIQEVGIEEVLEAARQEEPLIEHTETQCAFLIEYCSSCKDAHRFPGYGR